MKRSILSIFLSFITFTAFSQTGGDHIYDFLNLGSSARVEAMGGYHVALSDVSADYVFYNPAGLTAELDNNIAINYVHYVADINFGYAGFVKHIQNIGTFSAGMHYVNYGEFAGADADGKKEASFRAADYALLLSYSRKIDRNFTVGVTLKPIYSALEKYHSFGLAADIAVIYDSSNQLFRASLIARNVGLQITPYYGSHRERLPNELLAGVSYRLEHAPLRFALTYRHLQKFDTYFDTKSKQPEQKESFSDKALNHLTAGIEFMPSKNISLRVGYNFQRRNELSIQQKKSTVGLSWGFGFKVNRFRISYASAKYHLAGASNVFSITTSLNQF